MQKPLIVTAVVVLIGLLGYAQSASAGYFKERQARQHQRIHHGIAGGELTRGEAHKLFRDQRQVRQLKRHFLADGRLSSREQRILKQRLDRSSHRIYRYKHNHRRMETPRHDRGGFRLFVWH